ncbi:MAG: LTA synthase family protein [Saccharofermentans sp.]|nr:LTA synthase family protein [Saccharofermentans sp.]
MPKDENGSKRKNRESLLPEFHHRSDHKKGYIIRTLIFIAVMYIFLFLHLKSSGTDSEDMRYYSITAAIFAFAIFAGFAVKSWGKIIDTFVLLAAPAITFLTVECYTHKLSEMWAGPVKLNFILYYLVFFMLALLVGKAGLGMQIAAGFTTVFGLFNYILIVTRNSPLLPWDFYSIRVAGSVAGNYEFILSLRALNVLLGLIVLFMILGENRIRFTRKKIRFQAAAVLLVVLIFFVRYVQTDEAASTWKMDTTLFTPKVLYRNNGLMLSFTVNCRYLSIEKPSGYSASKAAEEAEEVRNDRDNSEADISTEAACLDEKPNIIVIMNEAFSDISVVSDFETNIDYLPNIHALSENTRKGWMYVSVKGGNTANTEFEFLTQSSMYFLPAGSIPYQQYIRDEIPSLASQLAGEGYRTIGIHPYYATGWNRDSVYELLGFNETYFKDAFSNAEIFRTYVSDRATFEKIEELYETKAEGEKLFVFDVTMQNHGSYYRFYDNFTSDVTITGGSGYYLEAAEQYLSLIKESDKAFQELIDYFSELQEPTIILMFGDHQPADYITNIIDTREGDSLEEEQKRYIVPYVMWANYDIEESDGDVTSVNYLGCELLKYAGFSLTDYQYYLNRLSEEVPVITANMAVIADGSFHARDEEGLESILSKYAVFQYNNIEDIKNRVPDFFTYTK